MSGVECDTKKKKFHCTVCLVLVRFGGTYNFFKNNNNNKK
ncbi:hypothetical protein DDB_G0278237 [Dictyostelium discoideum AX4]|uniref:Uncharacterized protein n=1 Tax=Dictyostelium discoideum TaxID=44689 RepID=Q54YH3_DICDI|nr:hypothetical protein DDB_G0278237 [Dictyostelium discoideum AX4]EAL68291.1 hypothetical protein DDB_G0278237 [Dictyostelium discoideum AX4]|eukprot:XP_642229.1 hypothetical protein DDB_G0278237 [Dictyostelium discoideum AX4]